jgi:phenylacetic acid degradation operon negative regulatory protein
MSLAVARVPHDWSDRRSAGAPSARSLLFTVLGEFVLPAGGDVWSGTLIRSLGALGVEEKAARQAIARTAADGWLARTRAGRRVQLQLTDAGRELLETGAGRIYGFGGSQEHWDGRWVLLFVDETNGARDKRHRLRTKLAWAGFGSLRRSGTWIAAHAEREDEARAVLAEFGLRDAVSFVASSGDIGDPSKLIREAWDLDALEDRYEEFITTFETVRPASPEDAFVALTQLVHEWRRFPFLDPGLSTKLLPARWSGDCARTLFHQRRRNWAPRARRWFESN